MGTIKPVIIIMGVSGSGKTSMGKRLAGTLDVPFFDADDYHPQSNIEKMKSGTPLNDEDRKPWLELLAKQLPQWSKEGAVLACSALKESYRQLLQQRIEVQWVVLTADFETIHERMKQRSHFMPADLLRSQFETLELPDYGFHLDVSGSWKHTFQQLLNQFQADE